MRLQDWSSQKTLRFAAIGAVLVLGLLAVFLKRTEGLSIVSEGHVAPLDVTIIGPESVTNRCRELGNPYADDRIFVDWGDGSDLTYDTRGWPPECSERRWTHRYSVPGTYRITAERRYQGPDDRDAIDWSKDAYVTVTGKPATDSLELFGSPSGEYRHLQPFEVGWRASVSAPSQILVEAIAPDGTIIATSPRKPWSRIGEGFAKLWFHSEAIDAAFKNDHGTFVVQVSLMRDGIVVRHVESGILRMSPDQ